MRLAPVSWSELVRRLRVLGFQGPYHEGKHPYMMKGNLSITIPNPHQKQISVDLPSRILKQAKISRKEWLRL